MKMLVFLGAKMICKFNGLIDLVNLSRFASLSLSNSDVNVTSGNICLDAKSIMGIASLDISKLYNVEIITQNEDEKEKFIRYVEQFKAQK